jgi:hypothetical protein
MKTVVSSCLTQIPVQIFHDRDEIGKAAPFSRRGGDALRA